MQESNSKPTAGAAPGCSRLLQANPQTSCTVCVPPKPRELESIANRVGSSTLIPFARQLAPQTDVGDSLVVARYHHFCSLGDRAAVFAARAADATCANLRINDFARPSRADRNRNPAQHAGHFVV